MPTENRQVRLAARPRGLPTPDVWEHTAEAVADPVDGQFLARVRYISLDPAMRGWMNEGRSYIPPVGIGEVMRAGAIAEIVASRHDGFAVGDHVSSLFGVQEYALSDGTGVTKVDPSVAELPTFLGTLGMPGMTAYFGLLEEGRPAAGETVVVSGAAGAVGTAVGQIAKLKGCRVVGIAGGAEKCAWLTGELGFDAAVDYKAGDVRAALRAAAPRGVDVFFDNVGGEILDDVLTQIRRGARIVICGAISQYNADGAIRGPSNYLSLLVNRASMKGMVVFDYADRYAEAARELAGWIAEGSMQTREQVVAGGVEAFPDALLMLFAGENTGKLVLEVA